MSGGALAIKKKVRGIKKGPLFVFSVFFSTGLILSIIEGDTFFRNLHLIGITVCLGNWILLHREKIKE
ncbi:hypothetical protein ACIQYS_20300 [Psychrobacillus sp. NPDC096426]|uniref:hypothetical protein n=1 Tax=Psychrobacillus sp. NPDC096426 TaxID=3364491 RepID=UPI00382207C0